MKRFAVGDIHGNPTTLQQCFSRSGFNKKEDLLIVLGDVVDGWAGTPEVIEELMTIKNLVLITGNHDLFLLDYYKTGIAEHTWTSQGGHATLDGYKDDLELLEKHVKFLKKGSRCYELDNMLFVHGGVPHIKKDLWEHSVEDLSWDRSLYIEACQRTRNAKRRKKEPLPFGEWDTIFIGHTSTTMHLISGFKGFGLKPVFVCNIINLDTGGGYEGKLTIMDIDTKKYWQSDLAKDTGWER